MTNLSKCLMTYILYYFKLIFREYKIKFGVDENVGIKYG